MTDTGSNGSAVALVNPSTGEVVARDAGWWERGDLVALAKDQFMPGATDGEFGLFLETARALGLSPFARQIFAVKRWDAQAKREKWSHQVSIDGFRLTASRTGKYQGQTPRQWCGPDGVWRDVWLDAGPPAAARVGVYHADFREPLYGVATFNEYVQRTKEGKPAAMWRDKPALMVAKCAEALALRAAFPAELSGVYTDDEMGQASVGQPEVALPTFADTLAELGIDEATCAAWWTRDGAAWDDKARATLARMTTDQIGRAGASIAQWREAQVVAAADAMVANGDATDEDAPVGRARGRRGKAAEAPAPEPEAVPDADVTIEHGDPIDEKPRPEDFLGPAPTLTEEDGIPF